MIQIDGKKGSDGFFLLKECLEKLFDKSFVEHQVQFSIGFNPSEENIEQFSEILTNLLKHDSPKIRDVKELEKITKIQIKIQITRGEITFQNKKFLESIQFFIQAMDSLELLMKSRGDQIKTPEEEDYIEFRLIDIYQKIGLALQEIKNYSTALKFFKKYESISFTCDCYKKMIENEKEPLCKLQYMEQYAKFCSEYGRNSSAIEIYQQIIDKFLFAPDSRRKAMT